VHHVYLTRKRALSVQVHAANQTHTQQKMKELQPQLDALKKKYKDDQTRLQQAQMDLFREAGINPMGGCLFAFIQIPVFYALYQSINTFVEAAKSAEALANLNKLTYHPLLKLSTVDTRFFMFDLASTPAAHALFTYTFPFQIKLHPEHFAAAHYLLIPFVTGLLQYLQVRITMPTTTPTPASNDKKKEDETPSMSSEFQSAMNTQMKYFLPVMIGYLSYGFPVGLSLYWNIFSLFAILQGVQKKKDTHTDSKYLHKKVK
jgi:YidC/Oxa1 family membrane protein insertase